MPFLNSHGEWCAGVGDGIASWGSATAVGTTIWTPAGSTCWLGDDTIIARYCPVGGGCSLKTHNVRTNAETTASANSANTLYAGGGVWAAWLAGVGVFTSTPPNLTLPDAGVGPVGPDGAIAIKRLFQSAGPYDVHETNGDVWLLTQSDASSIHLLGQRRACWIENGEARAIGVPEPNPGTRPFWFLRMVETPTRGWYVLYQAANGNLVLHSVLSTLGVIVASGQNTFNPDLCVMDTDTIRVVWSLTQGELPTDIVVRDVDISVEGTDEVGGTPPPPGSIGTGGVVLPGVTTLRSQATFEIVGAAEEMVTLPLEVFPAFPNATGYGRIVHPILGAFDYEVKPDEWVNIDADAIIPPVWASTRTLTSAANVLWDGNLRDVMVEERWKALGGLAMPITQLRMLLAIWTTPIDPDVGYVHWYPNYITQVGFKVLPVNLSAGGQGIALDDVINYLDEYGDPIGWVTAPVVFTLKLVERL